MKVARLGLAGLAALAACHATRVEDSAPAAGAAPGALAAPVTPGATGADRTPEGAAGTPSGPGGDVKSAAPDMTERSAVGTSGEPTLAAELELGSVAGPALPKPEPEPDQTPARPPASEDEQRAAAIDAIAAGDFSRARDLLEELIVGSRLQEGRRLLAEGHPLEAVAVLEDVRHEAPGRQDTLLPFAEASLQAGRQLGEPELIERALSAFTQIDGDPAGAFGASRAAAELHRTDEALRYAREGLRRLDARGPSAGASAADGLAEPGERTWARAALDAFYLARTNQSAESDALKNESEDALARYLGTNSHDAWIWIQLGALAEREDRPEEARMAYERGLHRASSEAALLDGLWRVSYQLGGWVTAEATMTRVLGAHPELARARFDLGVAHFELAFAHAAASAAPGAPGAPGTSGASGTNVAAEYAAAERDFAVALRSDASFESAVLGWQAVCRAGVGWFRYHQGDLAGARAAFESMEELFPGGMRVGLPDRMPSGVDGLEFVGGAFQKANALADAASTFDRLFAYDPAVVRFANNAGFFNRDLAVQLVTTADDLERAARGELTDPTRLAELHDAAGVPRGAADNDATRRALARAAEATRGRATALFERSFVAYQKAAELAPDDVRIQNDVALILVYYLHRDWERARAWLTRAVELGERQLADATLQKDQRLELENAWGDAHENLGVLALEHDRDAAAARKWFQRAIDIGPDPRPKITDHWLKQCDELEAQR